MSYELFLQEKENYLHFQVTGENQPDTVRGYLADILKECMKRGTTWILVEENLRGPGLSVLDIFRISAEGTQNANGHLRRVAYVDSNPDHSYANMKFATTVASNRGLNVRMFSSVKEAEEWLRLSNGSSQE